MWSVEGQAQQIEFFAGLKPQRILLEFDGPRLFTSLNREGLLFLVHQLDEEPERMRFLVVPFDDHQFAELAAGYVTLRAALTRSAWRWIVDADVDGQPLTAWSVDTAQVPDEVLPRSWVVLSTDPPGQASSAVGPPRSAPRPATQRRPPWMGGHKSQQRPRPIGHGKRAA